MKSCILKSRLTAVLMTSLPFLAAPIPLGVAAEKPRQPVAREKATAVVRFPGSPPAIVVYGDTYGRRYAGRPKPQGPNIFVAAWADGHVIWSKDKLWGGPPYLVGEFDASKLKTLLDGLLTRKVFDDASLGREYVGPGAAHVVVEVSYGKNRLRMLSWHEMVERRDNLVATARGSEPLAKRTREEVLREQPAAYRQFREVWKTVRKALSECVPSKGRVYAGSPPLVGKRKT
jgi:hypothetical protein